tara:strand:- start:47 stop:430 length:384 start_codon:yes stop_codon:yes gene_type:complete
MIKFSLSKLFIISLIFSFNCNADWVQFGGSDNGNIFYVDLEKVKKIEEYVYWWQLIDKKYGSPSLKFYIQADCKKFRVKILSVYNYKESMGRGEAENIKPPDNWAYPPSNTPGEKSLKAVCKLADKL